MAKLRSGEWYAGDDRTGAFASPKRGWERLYVDHVQQADTGGDLNFLVGASGPGVARESH